MGGQSSECGARVSQHSSPFVAYRPGGKEGERVTAWLLTNYEHHQWVKGRGRLCEACEPPLIRIHPTEVGSEGDGRGGGVCGKSRCV